MLAKLARREKQKARFLRIYKEKLRQRARERAYRKFGRLLRKAMYYAIKHPVPALVSPRLRLMSDVILEQLCDVRNLPVPKRTDTGAMPV